MKEYNYAQKMVPDPGHSGTQRIFAGGLRCDLNAVLPNKKEKSKKTIERARNQ